MAFGICPTKTSRDIIVNGLNFDAFFLAKCLRDMSSRVSDFLSKATSLERHELILLFQN